MTTAGQGSTPTALDLLFGSDADAAETLAGEILSPGRDQDLGRAVGFTEDRLDVAPRRSGGLLQRALVSLHGAARRGVRRRARRRRGA